MDGPEYVVVGSGAGGGTAAARLAEAGGTVMLLEAGGEDRGAQRRRPRGTGREPPARRLRRPGLPPVRLRERGDALGLLRPPLRHDELQRRDPNHREEWGGRRVDGVLYPRAGTLGGCTAHNAMILVCPRRRLGRDREPHRRPVLVGGQIWAYFVRLENCRLTGPALAQPAAGGRPHRPRLGRLAAHRESDPEERPGRPAARGRDLGVGPLRVPRGRGSPERLSWLLRGALDPNDVDLIRENAEGVRYAPMTRGHRRIDRASACSRRRGASPTGSGSSWTRWRPAC